MMVIVLGTLSVSFKLIWMRMCVYLDKISGLKLCIHCLLQFSLHHNYGDTFYDSHLQTPG